MSEFATAVYSSSKPLVPAKQYHPILRYLHWVSAAVIIWATISGFYAGTLPDGELRASIGGFNVALTACFVPVFLTRIAVRIAAPDPEPIPGGRKLQKIAEFAHVSLYAATLVVLVTGVLAVDHEADIFGFAVLQPIGMSEAARDAANLIHSLSCYGLALMVILHIAAVIFHRLQGRQLLHRMQVWP